MYIYIHIYIYIYESIWIPNNIWINNESYIWIHTISSYICTTPFESILKVWIHNETYILINNISSNIHVYIHRYMNPYESTLIYGSVMNCPYESIIYHHIYVHYIRAASALVLSYFLSLSLCEVMVQLWGKYWYYYMQNYN